MKKDIAYASAVIIVIIVFTSTFFAMQNSISPAKDPKKPFFLGVTYCGQSITEAHQLIDRVKDFTNLFVIQSGPLQNNISALHDIGDYAVDSGLDLVVYMGNYHYQQDTLTAFLKATGDR